MSTNAATKYSMLKRKFNQKEEENLCLREQIREYECTRCNSSSFNQATLTRLELERDTAKGDCVRLREENNALRDDIQRLKESERCEQKRFEQAQKDFESCVGQFEVERAGLNSEIRKVSDELRQWKDRMRDLQAEASEHRTRCNHLKLASEQTERELRTTQDLLQQTEAELANALDRIQELNDDSKKLEWELKEARQEKVSIKANMSRLDQEKDSLILKVDEKTEQNVRLEAELQSRDHRIASLEGFIADLQRKLDIALDTAARSEQTSRQNNSDTDRLRKELDKMERCRDLALKENSRLQNDLAAITHEYQENSRALETTRREVEDLKLQLQGYVAEVRRISQMLEEKEAERMAMLEHFRSLTVESANLETNNHSLESEARSTKGCLREAQSRLQSLETSLQEKKDLVCSYEKQIKELTQQVAKLERKLDSRSRAENATRDLSRELETQKHCLSQKVEELSQDKKQLEEEVCQLREELSRMQEMLSKERKNSATLENVLTSSRQETLQRTKDNGELKAQVHSLQAKLRDLHEKLEHGSEALRRCQCECNDYESQVAELRREVTNERFERARVEETRRRSRLRQIPVKRVLRRSHSLTCLKSFMMSPPYVCPCCFLNHISSLRTTPESSKEVMGHCHLANNFRHNCHNTKQDLKKFTNGGASHYSETSTMVDSSVSVFKVDSEELAAETRDFMWSGRSISNSKVFNSSETFTVGGSNQSFNPYDSKQCESETNGELKAENEILAEKIDFILQEQMKFIKELELPIICDEEGFRLEDLPQVGVGSKGDCAEYTDKTALKIKNKLKKPHKKFKFDKFVTNGNIFFATGDKQNVTSEKETSSDDIFFPHFDTPNKRNKKKNNKRKVHFSNEPIKLSKSFDLAIPTQVDNNLFKNYNTDKNISVKMLFFPNGGLSGSNSSVESHEDEKSMATTASVYVTAVNSCNDGFKESNANQCVYTIAGSTSSLSVNVTSSESTSSFQTE